MAVSRRAVLSGLVASTAAGACGGASGRPPPITTRFVGSNPDRAHRLRDGTLPEPVNGVRGETQRTPVLIVGGGVSGMAAAWRLHRAGHRDVVMLELESGVGGTARGGEIDGARYPMGAHYLPAPHAENQGLWTLLRDMGLVVGHTEDGPELDPRIVCRAPLERHKAGGVWSPGLYPARGQTADEAAQWERWREHLRGLDARRGADGRRLFELPVDRSAAELRHLDTISAADYLDGLGLSSPRLRWVMEYACRDDYGCTLPQTSAFAMLHHELARGLEDTHDRLIITFPEGNARLVSSMQRASELGDKVRSSVVVHRIDPDTGTAHAWDLEHDTPLRVQAEVVLWAAPRFVLRHVLPPGRDPLGAGAMQYAPWMVANVLVRKSPGGFGALPAWDNVAVDSDHLGYVRAGHNLPLDRQMDPGGVLTFYQPFPADNAAGLSVARTALLQRTLPQWQAHIVGALSAMHPGIEADIAQIDVARWGHAMVRPSPGWLFGPDRAVAAAPIGRVLPCAADVGGLPLFEEAYACGVAGAEAALSRLGRPEASIL